MQLFTTRGPVTVPDYRPKIASTTNDRNNVCRQFTVVNATLSPPTAAGLVDVVTVTMSNKLLERSAAVALMNYNMQWAQDQLQKERKQGEKVAAPKF